MQKFSRPRRDSESCPTLKAILYNILICSMLMNLPEEERWEKKKELSEKFQQSLKWFLKKT